MILYSVVSTQQGVYGNDAPLQGYYTDNTDSVVFMQLRESPNINTWHNDKKMYTIKPMQYT